MSEPTVTTSTEPVVTTTTTTTTTEPAHPAPEPAAPATETPAPAQPAQQDAPAPPYDGVPLPRRFRDMAFDELPMGLQARVRMFSGWNPQATPTASEPVTELSVTVGDAKPQPTA